MANYKETTKAELTSTTSVDIQSREWQTLNEGDAVRSKIEHSSATENVVINEDKVFELVQDIYNDKQEMLKALNNGEKITIPISKSGELDSDYAVIEKKTTKKK